MSYKIFYLIVLMGVSLLSSLFLMVLYLTNNKKTENFKGYDKAILFTSLAIFSWAIVASYKIFDLNEFSLLHLVNDRILSSMSNLFLLLSIPYYPISGKHNKFITFSRNKEVWLTLVFVFMISVIGIFTVVDKVFGSLDLFTRFLVVSIDSMVSISCLVMVAWVIYYSLKEIGYNKILSYYVVINFGLFALTQILLPLSKLFPENFSEYYPIFLAFFLIILTGFISSIIIFFIYLNFVIENLNSSFTSNVGEFGYILNDSVKIENIISLIIGLNDSKNTCFITIDCLLSNKENYQINIDSGNKLLQPFIYWILFAVGKKNNIAFHHPDISIAKFRMVEFINKHSHYKLSQELVFLNDHSEYSLRINSDTITIVNFRSLAAKKSLLDIFSKHAECFIDIYGLHHKFNTKLKNEKIKLVKDNMRVLLDIILKH